MKKLYIENGEQFIVERAFTNLESDDNFQADYRVRTLKAYEVEVGRDVVLGQKVIDREGGFNEEGEENEYIVEVNIDGVWQEDSKWVGYRNLIEYVNQF